MKTGKTYCKVHPELELTEDVEESTALSPIDGYPLEDYYIHPCPICLQEERAKARRQLVNKMAHVVDYELKD